MRTYLRVALALIAALTAFAPHAASAQTPPVVDATTGASYTVVHLSERPWFWRFNGWVLYDGSAVIATNTDPQGWGVIAQNVGATDLYGVISPPSVLLTITWPSGLILPGSPHAYSIEYVQGLDVPTAMYLGGFTLQKLANNTRGYWTHTESDNGDGTYSCVLDYHACSDAGIPDELYATCNEPDGGYLTLHNPVSPEPTIDRHYTFTCPAGSTVQGDCSPNGYSEGTLYTVGPVDLPFGDGGTIIIINPPTGPLPDPPPYPDQPFEPGPLPPLLPGAPPDLPHPTPPGAGTVSISASPSIVEAGIPVTLSWSSTNCTGINVTGEHAPGTSGSDTLTPSATATFTISGIDPSGATKTASCTVTVNPAPAAPVVSISALPSSIPAGQYAAISWSSSNCASVTVTGEASATLTGMDSVSPGSTTTYTITGTSADGRTATASCTLTVTPDTPPITPPGAPGGPPPFTPRCPVGHVCGPHGIIPTCPVGAVCAPTCGSSPCTSPPPPGVPSCPGGEPGCTVDGPNPPGSCPGGTPGCSINGPDPVPAATVTITASPNPIPPGGTSTLSWTSTNCSSVNVTGEASPGLGGSDSVTPAATTTYTITGVGDDGTSPTANVTITVSPAAPPAPAPPDGTIGSPGTSDGCSATDGFPELKFSDFTGLSSFGTWGSELLSFGSKILIWLAVPQNCVLDQTKEDMKTFYQGPATFIQAFQDGMNGGVSSTTRVRNPMDSIAGDGTEGSGMTHILATSPAHTFAETSPLVAHSKAIHFGVPALQFDFANYPGVLAVMRFCFLVSMWCAYGLWCYKKVERMIV